MARIKRETAVIGGCTVGYIRLGTGTRPPVILLHGLAADALTWQFNLNALAKDRPVVALDLPGHGRSAPPHRGHDLAGLVGWLDDTLQFLARDGAHVVGHSFGGLIAYRHAFLHPQRIRTLTLVASAGLGRVFNQSLVRDLVGAANPDAIAEAARKLTGNVPGYDEYLARALLAMPPGERRHLEPLLATITRQFAEGPAPDWETFTTPVQLVWDPADPVIPVPEAPWRPPAARLHLLERTGHLPHLVEASRFNALLGAFMAAHDPGGPAPG